MNIWENAVLTNQGKALQSKLIAGNTLEISKIQIGEGYVSPALLMAQTAVTSPKKTLNQVSAITYPEEGKCAVTININNDDVTTGYTAKQIGFYAMDGDVEILYFIAQAENGMGTIIPSNTEMPGYSAEFNFYFQYGQADNVTVVVDPSNSVSQAYVDSTFVKKSGDTMTGNLNMGENIIDVKEASVRYDGIQKYAALNDLEFFPDGKTLLEYANECNVTTQVMVVQGHIPADAPAQVEAHVFVAVGAGGRKTIIFMPYNNASAPTYMRDVFNNAWNENAWRVSGGFAQEVATDLHEINECKAVQTNGSTLNTPYKEGLTAAAHGTCIVSATGNYKSLVFVATSASRPIYYQTCNNGAWGPWCTTSIVAAIKDNALYVSPQGNDTSGNGTSAAPYASLAKALAVIPKDLGGQKITINIASGTYTEAGVNITDFYGGELEITGDSTTPPVFTNRIYAMGCSARIALKYIHTRATETWGGITASRCRLVEINDCKVDATVTGKGFGIYSAFMSAVYVHNTQVNNCLYGVSCVWGNMYVSTMTGTGNTYSAHAGSGGRIGIANTVPGYNTAQYVTYSGGRIYKDGQSNVPRY